ncbi:MAG: aa3-type cytochrome oxidase subunit II [Candidatus Nanopelagicaceae bacterium]
MHLRSKRVRRSAKILWLSVFAALTLTGCGNGSVYGYESDISSVNEVSWHLWRGFWLAAAVVGIFTAILILWPVFRHRRKEGDPEYPKQTQYNIPVEVAYTIIPFIIVAGLFYYNARDQEIIIAKEPTKVMHTIDVTGIQWSWQFGHQDGGPKAVVTGTPAQPPTLVLPQGERVAFKIHSNDVVHGFWIPAFMIQIQNLPGVTNHIEFTANKLGEYPGRCNILCGRNHSQMVFKVKVVTAAEYKTYVENLKATSEAGA